MYPEELGIWGNSRAEMHHQLFPFPVTPPPCPALGSLAPWHRWNQSDHELGDGYRRLILLLLSTLVYIWNWPYRCKSFYCVVTNLRFVATLRQASLSAPFFQQHWLTLCFCVTFRYFSRYFKLSHCYCICYGDLWSAILDVTAATCWRLRWWLASFSNKVFLIKVCTFLRRNAIAHLIEYSIVWT